MRDKAKAAESKKKGDKLEDKFKDPKKKEVEQRAGGAGAKVEQEEQKDGASGQLALPDEDKDRNRVNQTFQTIGDEVYFTLCSLIVNCVCTLRCLIHLATAF